MRTGEKIKILTITTSGLAHKEGISTVILDNFSRLDKMKYDLQIIASGEYSYGLVQAFQSIGVVIRCLPSRKLSPRDYFKEFIRLFNRERYDVIYIHGSSAIMAIEFYIAKHFGCKVRIAHSHNTTCNHKMIDKILRPFFYRVITNRLACGQDAGKWLYGNRTFTVIKNGRNPSVYKFDSDIRKKKRQVLELSIGQLAIGHVGSFNEQKNQKYLIDVFKVIKEKVPTAKLYLMGDGRKREDTAKHARELGIIKDVVFTGNIQDIPEMLQAMDVMALPSLHEGLPLVVVEWQMAGLPCVISDRVTDECAFSDLVTFVKLNTSEEKWADEIIKAADVDRTDKSEKAIAGARAAGFDINEDAIILEKILSGEV